MAIVFDWYENPNASSEEEAALHPRIFMNGKVDTDTLCYKIHDYSSLTVGDVKNVLDNLSKILGESLREGKEVHIEGTDLCRRQQFHCRRFVSEPRYTQSLLTHPLAELLRQPPNVPERLRQNTWHTHRSSPQTGTYPEETQWF